MSAVEPTLVCTSCGAYVLPGDRSQDTYRPDGCDHWYVRPDDYRREHAGHDCTMPWEVDR